MDDEHPDPTLELTRAVHQFFAEATPGDLITGYLLLAVKESPGHLNDDNSWVVAVAPPGQSYVTTRGLIGIAHDGEAVDFDLDVEDDD